MKKYILMLLFAPLILGASQCQSSRVDSTTHLNPNDIVMVGPENSNVNQKRSAYNADNKARDFFNDPCILKRESFTKRQIQPCIGAFGVAGVEIWTFTCTSATTFNSTTYSCVPNGKDVYCPSSPSTTSSCLPVGVDIPETDFPWP